MRKSDPKAIDKGRWGNFFKKMMGTIASIFPINNPFHTKPKKPLRSRRMRKSESVEISKIMSPMQSNRLPRSQKEGFQKSFILSSNDPLNEFFLKSDKRDVKVDKSMPKGESLNPIFEEPSENLNTTGFPGKILSFFKRQEDEKFNRNPLFKLLKKEEIKLAIVPKVNKNVEKALINKERNPAKFKNGFKHVYPKSKERRLEAYMNAPSSFDIAVKKTRINRRNSIMTNINNELKKIASSVPPIVEDDDDKAARKMKDRLLQSIPSKKNKESLFIDSSIQTEPVELSLDTSEVLSDLTFKERSFCDQSNKNINFVNTNEDDKTIQEVVIETIYEHSVEFSGKKTPDVSFKKLEERISSVKKIESTEEILVIQETNSGAKVDKDHESNVSLINQNKIEIDKSVDNTRNPLDKYRRTDENQTVVVTEPEKELKVEPKPKSFSFFNIKPNAEPNTSKFFSLANTDVNKKTDDKEKTVGPVEPPSRDTEKKPSTKKTKSLGKESAIIKNIVEGNNNRPEIVVPTTPPQTSSFFNVVPNPNPNSSSNNLQLKADDNQSNNIPKIPENPFMNRSSSTNQDKNEPLYGLNRMANSQTASFFSTSSPFNNRPAPQQTSDNPFMGMASSSMNRNNEEKLIVNNGSNPFFNSQPAIEHANQSHQKNTSNSFIPNNSTGQLSTFPFGSNQAPNRNHIYENSSNYNQQSTNSLFNTKPSYNQGNTGMSDNSRPIGFMNNQNNQQNYNHNAVDSRPTMNIKRNNGPLIMEEESPTNFRSSIMPPQNNYHSEPIIEQNSFLRPGSNSFMNNNISKQSQGFNDSIRSPNFPNINIPPNTSTNPFLSNASGQQKQDKPGFTSSNNNIFNTSASHKPAPRITGKPTNKSSSIVFPLGQRLHDGK